MPNVLRLSQKCISNVSSKTRSSSPPSCSSGAGLRARPPRPQIPAAAGGGGEGWQGGGPPLLSCARLPGQEGTGTQPAGSCKTVGGRKKIEPKRRKAEVGSSPVVQGGMKLGRLAAAAGALPSFCPWARPGCRTAGGSAGRRRTAPATAAASLLKPCAPGRLARLRQRRTCAALGLPEHRHSAAAGAAQTAQERRWQGPRP